jgi:signal transduction histidine kinase
MTSPQRTSRQLFNDQLRHVQRDADQLFFWLLLVQWLFAVVLALTVSPYAWAGRERSVHLHVQTAVLFGGVLNALPLILIRRHPGTWITRHVVAAAQMLWSGLLIDLSGGRIETHFHVFGSLAFLAFYRDIGVLVTATLVVSTEHLLRGLLWPEAIYGVSNPEWWRFLEHASWVLFEDVVLVFGTLRARGDMQLLAEREATLGQTHALVEQQVELRTRELGDSLERYRALVENSNVIPWELDPATGKLLYIAPQAAGFFGCPIDQLQANFVALVHPDDRVRLTTYFGAGIADNASSGDSLDYRMITGDRRLIHVRTTLGTFVPGGPLRGITVDVSKQMKLEGELRQAQKLESVGKLAAGVAHEINTPVQFVSDSVHFVKTASDDLFALLAAHQRVRLAAPDASPVNDDEPERMAEDIGLPYLKTQVPRALELALEGLERVTGIVRSMKEFAYPHTAEMVSVNLNQSIQSTLTIARAEYKYVAELETELAALPHVRCHIGDINQVVLNIVVNAAHAIGAQKSESKGTIRVRTERAGDDVLIAISDTGGGIPVHLHERIFDPFFTTKDVGLGTGQGLAIARTIVVERHQGALWFDSQLGVGTTFYIRLPIAGEQRIQKPAA